MLSKGDTRIFIVEVFMKREDIKALVRQAIIDMSKSCDIAEDAVANVTANVGGFDAPFGSMVRRNIKTPKKKKGS